MRKTLIHVALASVPVVALMSTANASCSVSGSMSGHVDRAREHLSISSAALVQQDDDPYLRARQLFREGRFSQAVEILETALNTGDLGPSKASAWLLLAAARLGADAPEPALTALDGLDREYPDGPYLVERQWLRGRAHSRAGRYYEAALIYSELVEEEDAGRIAVAARDELALLIAERLPAADLQRLGNQLSGTDLKSWMAAVAAEELVNRGDFSRARRLLERIEAEAPTGGYGEVSSDRLAEAQDLLNSSGPSGLVIGVLAPMTGPDASDGREIMNAVRLAGAMADIEVDFRVRNTDGTIDGTIEGTLYLIRDVGAQILIGPVVEELAMIAASIAEARGVPILLPHTRQAAATGYGENSYQLQASPKIQAELLADAAIDSLGMQTFAVLKPVYGVALEFAEAFITRVEERGGTIVAIGEYYPGAPDYQPQITAIRRAGLALSLADTSDISFFDTVAIAEADEDTLMDLVPVGSIDAFVAPGVNSEDVSRIAAQVSFFYLVTTLLGGPAWNSYEVVNSGGQYVRGAIFTDTYSDGWASMQQIDFANNYYAMFSENPGRAATLTFDAARLAIAAWQMAPEGFADRSLALRRWLSGISNFEGASGVIDFASNARINDNVFFLTINRDRIEPATFLGPVIAPPPPPPGG
ncbi:ABC transporter substrate-binding protein [Gemmatimonadota bacterium]